AVSSRVHPVIRTPAHGSLPSGHATIAFFVSCLLSSLLKLTPGDTGLKGAKWRQLFRLAHRIAQSRVVAGVHFPMDSLAGRMLGETLANFFIARCTSVDALGKAVQVSF